MNVVHQPQQQQYTAPIESNPKHREFQPMTANPYRNDLQQNLNQKRHDERNTILQTRKHQILDSTPSYYAPVILCM